jgi:transposase, IS5 family
MRKSFQTQPALFAPSELSDHPAMKALDGLEALVDWGEVEALLPRGEGKAARWGSCGGLDIRR